MRSPKHLWSGDWERESAALSEELAGRRPAPARPAHDSPQPDPPRPESRPTPRPAPRRPARARPSLPRVNPALLIGLATVLVVAAAAFGISRLAGTSSSSAQTTAATAQAGPIDWLGMQIEGVNPGTVVIATVAPGSPGEVAGLEPGDQLTSVNGRSISATSDIGGAISGLRSGDTVSIQVSRGTTQVSTRATLAAPPSNHP